MNALLEEVTEKDIIRPMTNFWQPIRYEQEYLVKPNTEQAQKYQVFDDSAAGEAPEAGKFLSAGL